jgi:hypothetical protein
MPGYLNPDAESPRDVTLHLAWIVPTCEGGAFGENVGSATGMIHPVWISD